ncbi:MAG: M23 family metallopeptidase [Oscillospiraceae bacterium]|nr:M23 family metallopeptidase [Oscillospiraceae bacterium]
MNSSSSGKSPESFLTGKGFYIVLFLCAAVIGVSAWVMATGNEAMKKSESGSAVGGHRVETVIAPAAEGSDWIDETEIAPPDVRAETMAEPEAQEESAEETVSQKAPAVYVWPALGQVERGYSVSALKYDETLQDWRTHSGIDIACEEGASVVAARGGQVVSIVNDGLYGTVLTIDHGDGMRSVYANLAPETEVPEGAWVDAGVRVGTVGRSALCEIGQDAHLHFELRQSGASVDPAVYLPA